MEYEESLLGCLLLLGLHHEGCFSTLCACAWLHLPESLELELFALLRWSNLASHGVISMHLRIGHPHIDEVSLLGLCLLHRSEAALQDKLFLICELVHHDARHGCLRPQGTPISELLVRQGCRSAALVLLRFQFQVMLTSLCSVGLIKL